MDRSKEVWADSCFANMGLELIGPNLDVNIMAWVNLDVRLSEAVGLVISFLSVEREGFRLVVRWEERL